MPESHPFGPLNKPVVCHQFKRGRKALVTDSRTLKLARYITGVALPIPPSVQRWAADFADWGMALNDTLGDCTIAGVSHGIQTWTAANGTVATISDSTVEAYYKLWDGYDGTPDSDQGGIELDVLKKWRNQGFDGHMIYAFADPVLKNHTEVKTAIWLFGGLYIGFDVPNNIDEDAGATWDVAGAGPVDGGHCVFVVGYDDKKLMLVSWGSIYYMTWEFWDKFVDEAHAILAVDWFKQGDAPSGFDQAQLQADLAEVTR
jgi:hypothetical protein